MEKEEIRLPKLLQNGCVLQRGEDTRIWGFCEPESEITVKLQGREWKTRADKNGRFETAAENLTAGGPFVLELLSGNGAYVKVPEVYVGEVFVCAGQSNMELPMRRVKVRYPEEFAAGGCGSLHLYKVTECVEFGEELEEHRQACWSVCTGENLAETSAMSYFFGKILHENKGIPVGIINLSLGGTPAEAWTSRDGLKAYPGMLEIRKQYQSAAFREQILKEQEQAEAAWYQALEKQEKETEQVPWQTMQVPGSFDERGLKNFCGLLWLRKKFTADAETAGKKALLRFGTLVDSDQMYINGVQVGETGYCYPPRRYDIPEGLIQEGENELLIRLICRDGKGRITEGKDHDIITETGAQIALEGLWEYQIRAVSKPAPVQNFINRKPTGLFQGMVSPCLPYTVKGVVWYQGESNDAEPECYEALLKGMITDWRNHWRQDRLPFIVMQLPNCGIDIAPGESWCIIREAQRRAGELQDVAVTVNLDLGEDNDLHPLNKKDAAYRAFLAAEHLIYKQDIVSEGPKVTKIQKQGNYLELFFDTGDQKPLCTKEQEEPEGFEIQDADGRFYKVSAHAAGEKVTLDCKEAEQVKSVRYAWSKTPGKHLLYNSTGLPAGPFKIEIL